MTSMCSSECGRTFAHNVCTVCGSCCASYLQHHSALASDRLNTARLCVIKQVLSTHRTIRYPCQPFPWWLIAKRAIDPQLQKGAPAKSRRGVHSWLRQYASVTRILVRPNDQSFKLTGPASNWQLLAGEFRNCQLRNSRGQNAHLSKP